MHKYVHAKVLSCRGMSIQRHLNFHADVHSYITELYAHAISFTGTIMHRLVHAEVRSCTETFMQRYIHVHLMVIYIPVPRTRITR
jgi:hypothetical protein